MITSTGSLNRATCPPACPSPAFEGSSAILIIDVTRCPSTTTIENAGVSQGVELQWVQRSRNSYSQYDRGISDRLCVGWQAVRDNLRFGLYPTSLSSRGHSQSLPVLLSQR